MIVARTDRQRPWGRKVDAVLKRNQEQKEKEKEAQKHRDEKEAVCRREREEKDAVCRRPGISRAPLGAATVRIL